MALRKIKTRLELIYMLCEAAEIEHQLLLVYLFAAFSLKTDVSEGGVTEEQLKKIKSWRGRMIGVAIEEMCHLSIVSNLLTSIGGAPHFARPNMPQDTPKYYPPGFSLDLQAFSKESLQRFVSYENPNNPELKAPEFKTEAERIRAEIFWQVDDECQIVEEDIPFHTIHDLYDCIKCGFEHLYNQNPDTLFIGDAKSQLTNSKQVRLFEELIPIVDLKSVNDSIHVILEQGEGNKNNIMGHFRIFSDVLAEYEAELKSCTEKQIEFSPARNCIENPFIHQPADSSEVNIIEDEFTAEISLLFNASYDLMMKMIIRTFSHHEETMEEVALLVDTFISFMHHVLSPLGGLLCTLPVGKSFPEKTAGPSFEYPRNMHLLPHKSTAWRIFNEQLETLSKFSFEFSKDNRASEKAKSTLVTVSEKIKGFADKLKT